MRSCARSRRPISRSASSPKRWPSVSFTLLKWSMSPRITPTAFFSRRARSNSRWSMATISPRFINPVRLSWVAAWRMDLQEELVSARESMRHAATHDSLTGLMNRGEIVAMLQRELERARREKKPVGVILGDIDHFKSVNDTLGHLFGDEALREKGRRLRAQLRIYDGVGRYGGEEFLLVLPNCDLPNALFRANELRE